MAPSASGLVLLAFQETTIQEIRIKESLLNKSVTEIEAFRNSLKEISIKGFASIQSSQYAGLRAISFPILDMNGNAVAAITIPMLARIDGTNQVSKSEIEDKLRKISRDVARNVFGVK